MKRTLIVAMVVAATMLCDVVFAQMTSIEGTVIGRNGQPLVGAIVSITRTDIRGLYKVRTDSRGHYLYTGLPLGQYAITVTVGNAEEAVRPNIRTRLGDPSDVSFNLGSPAAAETPAPRSLPGLIAPAQSAEPYRAPKSSALKEATDRLARALSQKGYVTFTKTTARYSDRTHISSDTSVTFKGCIGTISFKWDELELWDGQNTKHTVTIVRQGTATINVGRLAQLPEPVESLLSG